MIHSHHAGASARFNGHVTDRHPTFDRQAFDGTAGELDRITRATGGTDLGDDRQYHVFGGHAAAQLTLDTDPHVFHLLGDQTLCRQHMLNLAGADTMSQGTKGAVG